MKKKLFFGLFLASGMLLATSCQNESDDIQQAGEAQVSFSLALEDVLVTRAISDGKTANELHYAVFDENGTRISTIDKVESDFTFPGNVTLTLAKNQTYQVAFWAQNKECDAYTVSDDMKVTVNYAGDNNDETRDAFFKSEKFTVTRNAQIPVVLKRPFAQVNVGVTAGDWKAAVASGIEIEKSTVTIDNAATSLNVLDGSVSGSTVVNYALANIPAAADSLKVDLNKDGKYSDDERFVRLSMSYILVNNEGNGDIHTAELNDLEFTFAPKSGNNVILEEGLEGAPVQRNWRTNIIGQLLTGNVEFQISIDPIYVGDYNYPEYATIADGVSYDAADKTFYVSSKNGLEWLVLQSGDSNRSATASAVDTKNGTFEGMTVKLAGDVDLAGTAWTPLYSGSKVFKGTFDGAGYTIKNMTVKTNGKASAALFATSRGVIKNVKLQNVNVQGHYKTAAIVADALCSKVENCHVDGGIIKSTPYNNDDANHVGGIVGYLSAEPAAYVKGCSVKNLSITAYRDCGAVVGTATGSTAPEISGNTADNVTVTANQLVSYVAVKDANAGKIVGRNIKGSNIESNNANNVVVNVLAPDAEGKVVVENVTLEDIANLSPAVKEIVLASDVKGSASVTNGYGAAGMNQLNGGVIDGGGYKIECPGADGTWDSAINTTGGTIKNVTVAEGFRGIFINHNSEYKAKVVLDNVIIDGTVYTISCDQGSNNGLDATKSTFNGWTSYAATIGDVTFTECNFGEGSGYSFCRPYAPTTFTKCEFEKGYEVDAKAAVKFVDCTYDGIPLTANNISALVAYDTQNATVENTEEVVETVLNDAQLATAVKEAQNGDKINLAPGNWVVPNEAKGKEITFVGTENPEDVAVAVTKVGVGGENCDYGLDGSDATFENITITTNSSTYIGYARCNGTYKNCIINGTYTLYGNSVFEDCTFNVSGDVYNVWTWGAPTATFTRCTFNSDGKALLLYGQANTKLTVNDCTFNDNGGLTDLKAAIEIGNDYNKSYELIVNNTTVNGYEINDKGIVTNTTLWGNKNSMPQDKLNVVVDGVDVY